MRYFYVMSLTRNQFEEILDEAIRQHRHILNPVFSTSEDNERYDKGIDKAIEDLDSKLPSPLKIDSSGYTVNGDTIELDYTFNESGNYDIDIQRVSESDYQGVRFDVDEVTLEGTIELSDDPRGTGNVKIVDSDIDYYIYGHADPY